MADGAFSHADAAAVKAALARLRSGNEADADSRPSCASKVVAAVDASRKDLSKRRTTGCIYLKVQQELAAPHVLLRAPRLALPVPVRRRAGSGDVPFNVRRCAALARAGAQAAVPTFLAALLDLADCAMTQLYLARADFFAISGDYLIMPNPAYFDAALFTTDAKLAARTLAASKGFGLVAWWIHPELRRRSRFYRCHASLRTPLRLARSQQFTGRGLSSDRTPAVSVAELLRAGDACPYLYDASDLELQHARGLRDVEKAVFAQLQDVYGVSAHRVAEADLYFHRQHAMWPDLDRAWSLTLHLHVAVERARTPACYCHSASVLGALARDRMFHLQGIVASTGSDS